MQSQKDLSDRGSSGEEDLDDNEDVANDVAEHEVERKFPDAFYDPTTDKIMTDPVVNLVGDSYDKNSMEDFSVAFYPNRALKAIIAREMELTSASFRGSLRRIDESVRSSWSNAVSKSVFGGQNRPLPDSFYCPITCDLIVDPFISPDGNSYERAAIVNWLGANDVSPITRNTLTLSELRPNNALYKLIQHEKSESVESQHPSIRRWQESNVDTSTRNPEPLCNDSTPQSSATTTTNESTLPTSYAEIRIRERSRRRQQQAASNLTALALFSIIVIALFVPYSVFIVVLLLMLLGSAVRSHRSR